VSVHLHHQWQTCRTQKDVVDPKNSFIILAHDQAGNNLSSAKLTEGEKPPYCCNRVEKHTFFALAIG
jgi:hypothetical protein